MAEAYPIATAGAEGAEGDRPLGLPPPPTKKGPDNNGQIDCAELGAALKKAGKEFTPEQVEAALAKHDKDKDGKLSWSEFQAIFQSDE